LSVPKDEGNHQIKQQKMNSFGGCSLHDHAKKGKWDLLLREAREKSKALMNKNEFRQTPFHYAVMYGAPTDVILDLLELEPGVLREKNDEGELPLHVGCRCGMSVTTLLAFLKIEPDSLNWVNTENRTALEVAKNAKVFIVGTCTWNFYIEDYTRVTAALGNPTALTALWEAQKATDHMPISNSQPVRDVWNDNQDAQVAHGRRLQHHLKKLDGAQVYVGIPVDPDIRANLAAINQAYD
jgi:hypothetical protein